jgi:hypothetical protein
MKTSQLIKALQDSLIQNGDVDVCFPDFGDDGGHIDIDHVVPEYAWKAGHIGVEDREAGVAFISLK